MNYLISPTVMEDINKALPGKDPFQVPKLAGPSAQSWDQVEDSIECAIKTVENAIVATAFRNEKTLSVPLRRLYNRSKKLRLARGKLLKEDTLDVENYITGCCMLGKFISGAC